MKGVVLRASVSEREKRAAYDCWANAATRRGYKSQARKECAFGKSA